MAKLLLLNGPNLNLLGSREPSVYGRTDLAEIESTLAIQAERLGHSLESLQSNAEHVLVEHVQRAGDNGIAFILLNPGAFTQSPIRQPAAMSLKKLRWRNSSRANVLLR